MEDRLTAVAAAVVAVHTPRNLTPANLTPASSRTSYSDDRTPDSCNTYDDNESYKAAYDARSDDVTIPLRGPAWLINELDLNDCHGSPFPSDNPKKKKKKKKHVSVRIVSEDDGELQRNPFPLLGEDILSSSPKHKENQGPLLRGPRRVLRLCLFALVMPLALVLVPLYIRVVRYPPKVIPMAPSDQRLLDSSVSSIWCQGQSVHMNGSFNAYLLDKTPKTKPSRPRYTVLKHLSLRDDFKEYWGFYLRSGSTVTLSSCTRHEGGQLMILRGSDNLHRCAWIGEEDSLEEAKWNMPTQADKNNVRVNHLEDSDENEHYRSDYKIGSRVFSPASDYTLENRGSQDEKNDAVSYVNSEERQEHINRLLKTALQISKGKHELLSLLGTEKPLLRNKNDLMDSPPPKLHDMNDSPPPKLHDMNDSPPPMLHDMNDSPPPELHDMMDSPPPMVHSTASKIKRSVVENVKEEQEEEEDGAFEETDDNFKQNGRIVKKFTKEEMGVEQIIGGLSIPDGLTYERGYMNQSHANDMSMEEHRSSYSSSEEALASCEGVIMALSLEPDMYCTGFERQDSNRVTYHITEDGVYYFVFSSDNEIVVNELYFNLTLDKVVYDTSANVANCSHSNNCSLNFDFWSNEKTVVEVPASNDWDNSYILSTECVPRVPIYLCLLLTVPLLILCCAFQ